MARKFVIISVDEAESVLDFMENTLIDQVRENQYFDSVECLRNLCRVMDKCEKAVRGAVQ